MSLTDSYTKDEPFLLAYFSIRKYIHHSTNLLESMIIRFLPFLFCLLVYVNNNNNIIKVLTR